MGDPVELENFNSEYKPEIEYIRKLDSKESYFAALTSNILYLALLYKQFDDKRIFKRLCKSIMDALLLFKDENLKDCLKAYSITESLLSNKSFQESLYWLMRYTYNDIECLTSFGKFIYAYMEELKQREEIGVKKTQIEKTIEAFANFFLVKIEFIQLFDELKLCLPDNLPPKIRIPTIFLVKINNYYGIGYTKLMAKVEKKLYEKGLQSKFFNDIYTYKHLSKTIDKASRIVYPDCVTLRGAFYSERTHISKLPLSEELKNELEDTYLHCHAITENFNLLTAFSLALVLNMKLPSNKEFFRILLKNFAEGKSMCRIQFNKSIYFKGLIFEEIIESMKEIIKISIHNLKDLEEDSLSEDSEYFIDNFLSHDFTNLLILSKVFGVSSKITVKHDQYKDECTTIIYNASPNYFRPNLDFLAINASECFRLYVLLSKDFCRENSFDFSTKESGINVKLIRKELCDYKVMDKENSFTQVMKNYKYLIEASNIQNKVIGDIMDCINESKPVKIDSHLLIQQLQSIKSLEITVDINALTSMGMQKLKIMSSHDLLIQTCHYCGLGDPDFSCSTFCYYHTKCIVEVYKIYYRSQPASHQKCTSEIILQCPKCRGKIMELSKFLDESYGQPSKIDAKEYFDKEYECSKCKDFFGINSLCSINHADQNCLEKLCYGCGSKKIIDSNSNFCKCEGIINLDVSQIKYNCWNCHYSFMFQEVLRIHTYDEYFCKRCLVVNIENETIRQILNDDDCYRVYTQLKDETILCYNCNKMYFKNYNKNKFCRNNCFQSMCIKCSENCYLSCCACGEALATIT